VAALGFRALGREMDAASRRAHSARRALIRIAVAYVRFGVENSAHYPSDATFAALTGALERGHGLATLLIDQRLSFLRLSLGEAERQAKSAGAALIRGLTASSSPSRARTRR
jgi:hypothetical protein